jgi:hypothetical protein
MELESAGGLEKVRIDSHDLQYMLAAAVGRVTLKKKLLRSSQYVCCV